VLGWRAQLQSAGNVTGHHATVASTDNTTFRAWVCDLPAPSSALERPLQATARFCLLTGARKGSVGARPCLCTSWSKLSSVLGTRLGGIWPKLNRRNSTLVSRLTAYRTHVTQVTSPLGPWKWRLQLRLSTTHVIDPAKGSDGGGLPPRLNVRLVSRPAVACPFGCSQCQ
jgi:hypothetical protein